MDKFIVILGMLFGAFMVYALGYADAPQATANAVIMFFGVLIGWMSA